MASSASPTCWRRRSRWPTAIAIEKDTADRIERDKALIKQWPYSKAVFLTHPGEAREAPLPGEIFRQPDLAVTLRKLVESERAGARLGQVAPRRHHGRL